MAEWNTVHRAFAAEWFFKSQESYTSTIRVFRKHFAITPRKPVPSEKTVRLWVKNFREKGTVHKLKPPGPSKRVRTQENIERVRVAVKSSPQRSARKHALSLNLSDRTVRRILHVDLCFHPYKMMMTQELLATDPAARLQFCKRILEKIDNDELPLNRILFTDEAHFYLPGAVNNQNMRYWSDENPRIIHEKPLHSPKLTVWMGVASYGLIGPFFFDQTVNGNRYREMLEQQLVPALCRKRKLSSTWFQQDGATCHTAGETMELLHKHFGNRIISRGTDLCWPPRSPDLSCCDYFLWGYLKSKVYINKPRDLEQLRANIERESAAISNEMLKKVTENFRKRTEDAIKNKGGHLRDIIFKT